MSVVVRDAGIAITPEFVQAFAEQELPHRQSHGYPPFAQMLRLIIRGPIEAATGTFADALAEYARRERRFGARPG